MIALGLLAKDPELRRRVLAGESRIFAAQGMGKVKVVGFSGRESDAPGGIWGSIAKQLGKEAQFAPYINVLSAPGPEAWRTLLGGEATIIFLDELPPYLEYAASQKVGEADLAVVTTAALANLFVAVAKMDNVCVVLSDLAGANYTVGQEHLKNAFGSGGAAQASFDRQVNNLNNEATREAVMVSPVNTTGDDFYHILRRRLFKTTASEEQIVEVAKAYEAALKEAKEMNLTSTAPSRLRDRILESYPFHPEFRDLLGKFKENPGFQQTRGVIRLMQMLISALWKDDNAKGLLIHPYDFDLNNGEIASYISVINPSLSSAIAHDISDRGNAVVEQIDKANGNTDASDAAKLLLLASLSTTGGAQHGLREMEMVDCLQRPGRDLSTFKVNVLDKLATNAWYLHTRTDGSLFFREQQNLAAKLKSTAGHLNTNVVELKLKDRLEKDFVPQINDCYQRVEVLSSIDVHLDLEKTTLVIVRPGNKANGLPISADWQAWWVQQEYKNRVLFLTGSKDTFQTLIDAARNSKALEDIQGELHSQNLSTNDPQWQALDRLRDRITQQFNSALKEAFDVVVYPSINTSLRATAISLDFPGNQNPEATIRQTLETPGKFTTKIDVDTFIDQAESRLFGTATAVLWSEFKRNAAVQTNWPLHKTSALDDLKARCIQRGRWRAEGNYVNKGPFAAPLPGVEIHELSTEEDGSGQTYL